MPDKVRRIESKRRQRWPDHGAGDVRGESPVELRGECLVAVRTALDQISVRVLRESSAIHLILDPLDHVRNVRIVSPHSDVVPLRVEDAGVGSLEMDEGAAERGRLEDARRHRIDDDFAVDVAEETPLHLLVRRLGMDTQISLAALPDLAAEVDHAGAAGRTEDATRRGQEVQPALPIQPIALADRDITRKSLL